MSSNAHSELRSNMLIFDFSPDVNVTYPNPMVGMNITWTEDMVSDLRSRMDNAMGSTALCKGWVSAFSS